MKFIRSFFLGALLGLGLAVAILAGLYVSPMREPLYFRADPDVGEVRARLSQYQDRFSRDELRIAQGAVPAADSLRATQAQAWKEYLRWRGRMAELAKVHAKPSPGGIWPWIYSLRLGSFPLLALLALVPGLLFGMRSLRFSPASPLKRPRSKHPSPTLAPSAVGQPPLASEAMKSFEAAVKQVARIADTRAADPRADGPRPSEPARREPSQAPQVDPRKPEFPAQIDPTGDADATAEAEAADTPSSHEASPYDMPFEPDTRPFPMIKPGDDAPAPKRKDRDTEFFQVGPGWGDSIRPGGDAGDTNSAAGGATGPAGLSMEDEDGGIGGNLQDEEDDQPGAFMPPTTEVERVERRKAEVLKLARKGLTSSEISRRLHMSQDQVEFIIRLRREKG